MSEEAERFGFERFVKKFVNKLARDFNVPSPDVVVTDEELIYDICEGSPACYIDENIYLADTRLTRVYIEPLLHEFAHHMQYIRAGRDAEKAFPLEEFSKPHWERSHEMEAEMFVKTHMDKYEDLYAYGSWIVRDLYYSCGLCADLIVDIEPLLKELIKRKVSGEELISLVEELIRKGQLPLYNSYIAHDCVEKDYKNVLCKEFLKDKRVLRRLKQILKEIDWWEVRD
jgi:hypothetical protein